MIRFSAFSPKLALGAAAALAAISLCPGSAQAFVVNVGVVQYDVTTFTGSYNDNTSKFALPPAPGVMPWWGSQSLAQQFAAAVGGNLGLPNNDFIDIGPFFGSSFEFGEVTATYFDGSGTNYNSFNPNASLTYARATVYNPPAAPVPGPLPALGAAAAFGFSRKLRKSIKRSTNAVSSSYSL
jgi:hypothetical protein